MEFFFVRVHKTTRNMLNEEVDQCLEKGKWRSVRAGEETCTMCGYDNVQYDNINWHTKLCGLYHQQASVSLLTTSITNKNKHEYLKKIMAHRMFYVFESTLCPNSITLNKCVTL